MHLLFALLGLLLPAVLFVSSYRRRRSGQATPYWSQRMKVRLYYGNGLLLWGLAGLVVGVWWWAGRPFTELGLGWGHSPYDLTAVLLLAAFALLYLFDLFREAGSAASREESRRAFARIGFLPATATQFMHFVFLAVAAGICEEIVYRGFMVTYLAEVFGPDGWGTVGALLVPAVSFGVGHYYQGGQAVFKIVLMAILFGFFFWRTQTLWPLMLLHTAVDLLGGVMSWWLLGRE
ncbi:MAG: CPBP family intramembrane glutamic endopeptidase [Bacteroidota bacterium]